MASRPVGPLAVSAANPHYFEAGGRAVNLTGSHIRNNRHGGLGPGPGCAAVPEANDYRSVEWFAVEGRKTAAASARAAPGRLSLAW
jgi:hypothetical protein